MSALIVLCLLLLIGAVAVMMRPELVWKANSWRFKYPEHNEPSDAAYVAYQVSAIVTAIAVIVMMGFLAQQLPSRSPQSEASLSAAPSPSPSPEYEPFAASREAVTTSTTDAGRFRAYSVDGQTVTVYIRRGLCASAQVPPTVEEDGERVVISYAVGLSHVWCDRDREATIAETVTLDEPLGDREVVDTDGGPLQACGPDEVRQTCPL